MYVCVCVCVCVCVQEEFSLLDMFDSKGRCFVHVFI